MIYLDSNATTNLDSQVLYAMMPYLTDQYANPNSSHSFGLSAREAVEKARASIARHINAQPHQIYFTSGASESNNTFLKGLWARKRHANTSKLLIFTSIIEHPSILNTVKYLCEFDPNLEHTKINVDEMGALSDFDATGSLTCSVHAANNEIGTLYDLAALGSRCKSLGVLFHTDATQAIGKIPIDVESQCIDALSFSGHKLNGPKGIGALYLRDESLIELLIHGGLQEGIRSGTLNVPGIIGLAKALDLTVAFDWNKIRILRDRLLALLQAKIPDLIINGGMTNRLPNNLNISIPGIKSEVFTKGMNDIIVSAGSACKSGNSRISDVLLAIGSKYPECAVRFGLGKNTTEDDIDYAAHRIISIVKAIRTNRK
jgi:cysteine desulfurase